MSEHEEAPSPSLPQPYYKAARYQREQAASNAYQGLQTLLFREECDLSAYRLLWEERWHVVALGEVPPQALEQRITTLLSRGQATSLPDEILQELQRRRVQNTQLGPWVERHYFPH